MGYTFNRFRSAPDSVLTAYTGMPLIWGCTGFDGGVEAEEASRSLPVCVKKGNLNINANKNTRSLAMAA